MSWLSIVIVAYLLLAITATIDKFLLSRSIPQPVVYTFNVGLLNAIATIFLLPLGFFLIPTINIFISILAGMSFILALFFLYKSIKNSELSRIVPYVGSLNPVFIFILAFLFLDEQLAEKEIRSFIFVIIGGILISWHFKKGGVKKSTEKSGALKTLVIATLSALLFATSYTLTKHIYESTEFINGFIWTRFGLILGTILLLIPPKNRKTIFSQEKKSTKKINGLFVFGQICGGLSFFLINYAFSISSVTLVHALQGLQYVFLFLIVIMLSKKFPKILREKLTIPVITQKILAISIISYGLYLLTI